MQLFLRGQRFGVGIFMTMLFATAIYAYVVVSPVYAARETLGLVRLGMTGAEVQYVLGKPSAQDAAGRTWIYSKDGRVEDFRFDASGRLEMAGCAVPHEAVEVCPATLGLGVGSNEAAITRRLGPADRVIYSGTTKRLQYDGLGLEFDVIAGQVKSMRLVWPEPGSSVLRHAVWALLP